MKYLKLLVCSLALTLTGCFYQSTDIRDIKVAIEVCGELDKVFQIDSFFNGKEYVTCTNAEPTQLRHK